jgi:hypothetical protein
MSTWHSAQEDRIRKDELLGHAHMVEKQMIIWSSDR